MKAAELKSAQAGRRETPPAHPGEIAMSAIKAAGISPRAAAIAMGATPQSVHNVLAGKSALSAEMALRFAALLGSEAEMWLKLQSDYDLWTARKKLKPELSKIARIEEC